MSLEQRFWTKVLRGEANECWPWTGAKQGKGYGAFQIGRRKIQAHRLSWELHNGKPFPEGMLACHWCNNPPCCNPSHVYPDTQSGNIKYAIVCERVVPPRRTGDVTHCKHGHEFSPQNTYTNPVSGWRTCRTCERERDRRRQGRKRKS